MLRRQHSDLSYDKAVEVKRHVSNGNKYTITIVMADVIICSDTTIRIWDSGPINGKSEL